MEKGHKTWCLLGRNEIRLRVSGGDECANARRGVSEYHAPAPGVPRHAFGRTSRCASSSWLVTALGAVQVPGFFSFRDGARRPELADEDPPPPPPLPPPGVGLVASSSAVEAPQPMCAGVSCESRKGEDRLIQFSKS